MAEVKEVKFQLKHTPSKRGSIKRSPVLQNSVRKESEDIDIENETGMKSVDLVIKPVIKPGGGGPIIKTANKPGDASPTLKPVLKPGGDSPTIKPALKDEGDNPQLYEANNLRKQGVLNEINSLGKLNKALKDTTSKKILDSPNIIREKKISNLEREKMLNKGQKDDMDDGVHTEREAEDAEKSNSVIMELENVLSFEDESGTESDTASVKISHKPSLDSTSTMSNRSTEDLSIQQGSSTDVSKDAGDTEATAFTYEKGSMIDELQKFLHKKYGPIVSPPSVTETPVKLGDSVKDITEKQQPIQDEQKQPDIKTTQRVPVLPMPQNPIFFKTSIKRDPGSKLHDALVSELQTVLRKRDGSENSTGKTDSSKPDFEGDKTTARKFPVRRISAKGNRLLGNKALLAKFEDQLNRTLHKNKVFERQRLKVLDLETVEINPDSDDSISNIGTPGVESPTDKVASDPKGQETTRPSGHQVANITVSATVKDVDSIGKAESENITSAVKSENESKDLDTATSVISGQPVEKLDSSPKEDDELFVYAYKYPSGRTEGVICSVQRRKSTKDSRGKLRKYLTCINIVTDGKIEGNYQTRLGCIPTH